MTKNRDKFDPIDREILEFLYSEGAPCTIQDVVDGTENIEWMTAKNRLMKLKSAGAVKTVHRPNKILFQFNYDEYE
jgi:hypothetical protein